MRRLLAPRSVAVVGATERPGAYGSEAVLNLARCGFGGAVYAVNPGRASVHGVPSFDSLAALPEAVDAVVVAVPAESVTAVVEEAGALGCGGAVVFAAGFAETRGGAGPQADLVAAARAHDLPVCGPNGNGIVSPAGGFALWGDQVCGLPAGPVALVTQSGNVAVNALAARRGLRLHTVVSCGNAAVLTAEDYVEAIAGLDGVESVALYLEDDGDGERWCDALLACADAGVGVAVLKAGSSPAGAAAAQAHTGAVAGDQRAVRAFFEACGAAWAEDPHDLLELAKALAAGGRTRGGGPGVGVMTCSGGDSSVAADLAGSLGVALPALAAGTEAALVELLPPAATVHNPLDYTSLLWEDPAALARAVTTFAADPAIDRVLVLYDEPAGLDGAAASSWAAVLDAVRAGARAGTVPVAVASTLPELLADGSAAALAADGLPALAGLRSGLRAVAALGAPPPDPARIAAIRAVTARRAPAADPARHVAGPPGPAGPRAPSGWLTEPAAKALLGDAAPAGCVVADAEAAVRAFRDLGGPVALKVVYAELLHKAAAGAVRLGLDTEAAVTQAARELQAFGAPLLVERMALSGVELLISVRTDTLVPVLVVGLGGAWTELLDDVAVLPLPVTAAEAEAALRGLRGARVAAGADLAAAAAIAVRAAHVALEHGLALLELNPVIAHVHGATAVDAVAATTQQGVLA